MNESDLARARALVTEAARIVAFSGAGLSAESGVATFRGATRDSDASAPLWTRFDPARLASPEGFATDPETVAEWYAERRRSVQAARPNPAHRALASDGRIVNVTQNVDDLLHRAGASHIVQVHGTLTFDRCHRGCGYRTPVDMADPPGLRRCPQCPGRLRPDVVWFGETLPPDVWEEAVDACAACDLMLVVGTSAEVYPAAGLIDIARAAGAAIVVVNTEAGGAAGTADLELIGPAGEILPTITDG